MLSFGMLACAAIVVPASIVVNHVRRRARRRRFMQEPANPHWTNIVEQNVALYHILPEGLKTRLFGHMHNFLHEKHFEGCGGLTMSEEIRVTIAAQACILLLNTDRSTYFPKCDSILVYPSAYLADHKVDMGSHVIAEKSARLGESWTHGIVVLAWDHVKQRALDVEGGHNVVLHEFAHQLDQEDGQGDGAPLLEHRSSYASWARVFTGEYEHLRWKAHHGVKDVMDLYGATDPAEFFAVATETFFEKGAALRNKHPQLYEQLKRYYKLDPATWNRTHQP
jgi:hypothetical protein